MIHEAKGKITSKDRRGRPVAREVIIYRCDQCGQGWSDPAQACKCGEEEAGEAVAALVVESLDEDSE